MEGVTRKDICMYSSIINRKTNKEATKKEQNNQAFVVLLLLRWWERMERKVKEESMESITSRLSCLDHLYFPRALQSNAATPSQRKSILLDLLSRDAAVFLERYGSELTSDELGEFDPLNNDYEINWHLKNLRSKMNPTSEDLRSRSVAVKNRRLAYLNRLIHDGHYFSEDAMREREPYLHHEYVGKFRDLSERDMARPGERWSETLMRRSEEAVLIAKIREEQQRLGVAEREWIGNERNQQQEEEEEEDDEEEDEDEDEDEAVKNASWVARSPEMAVNHSAASNSAHSPAEHNQEVAPSVEETQDLMEQFTYIMQQKFLSGEDHQHFDYSKIDTDETLDDHWLREVSQDAEEKYFAED